MNRLNMGATVQSVCGLVQVAPFCRHYSCSSLASRVFSLVVPTHCKTTFANLHGWLSFSYIVAAG